MADELTLIADSSWMSPWSFSSMVALEEKGLPYRLQIETIPWTADVRARLERHALIATTPILVHGDRWIGDSLAIAEYLDDRFPGPGHRTLFPSDAVDRARARQLLLWFRTGFRALREERPTSNFFDAPAASIAPLGDKARTDAEDLLRVATAVLPGGRTQLFDEWSLVDAELALVLMRLIGAGDRVPAALETFARTHWERASATKFRSRGQG